MRSLTILDPWATFIALGLKKFETRSWGATLTGPLAIHVGKKTEFAVKALLHDPYRSLLAQHGICRLRDFQFGHVICVAFMMGSHPTESIRDDLSEVELAVGDFGDDRFAWELAHVHRLSHPVPARGFQQIWNWQPPANIEQELKEWARTATGLGKAVTR